MAGRPFITEPPGKPLAEDTSLKQSYTHKGEIKSTVDSKRACAKVLGNLKQGQDSQVENCQGPGAQRASKRLDVAAAGAGVRAAFFL